MAKLSTRQRIAVKETIPYTELEKRYPALFNPELDGRDEQRELAESKLGRKLSRQALKDCKRRGHLVIWVTKKLAGMKAHIELMRAFIAMYVYSNVPEADIYDKQTGFAFKKRVTRERSSKKVKHETHTIGETVSVECRERVRDEEYAPLSDGNGGQMYIGRFVEYKHTVRELPQITYHTHEHEVMEYRDKETLQQVAFNANTCAIHGKAIKKENPSVIKIEEPGKVIPLDLIQYIKAMYHVHHLDIAEVQAKYFNAHNNNGRTAVRKALNASAKHMPRFSVLDIINDTLLQVWSEIIEGNITTPKQAFERSKVFAYYSIKERLASDKREDSLFISIDSLNEQHEETGASLPHELVVNPAL